MTDRSDTRLAVAGWKGWTDHGSAIPGGASVEQLLQFEIDNLHSHVSGLNHHIHDLFSRIYHSEAYIDGLQMHINHIEMSSQAGMVKSQAAFEHLKGLYQARLAAASNSNAVLNKGFCELTGNMKYLRRVSESLASRYEAKMKNINLELLQTKHNKRTLEFTLNKSRNELARIQAKRSRGKPAKSRKEAEEKGRKEAEEKIKQLESSIQEQRALQKKLEEELHNRQETRDETWHSVQNEIKKIHGIATNITSSVNNQQQTIAALKAEVQKERTEKERLKAHLGYKCLQTGTITMDLARNRHVA